MADPKEPDTRTPFEAFRDLVRRVVNVPKAEVDKREKARRRQRDAKQKRPPR